MRSADLAPLAQGLHDDLHASLRAQHAAVHRQVVIDLLAVLPARKVLVVLGAGGVGTLHLALRLGLVQAVLCHRPLDAHVRAGVDENAEAVGVFIQHPVGAAPHDDAALVPGGDLPDDGGLGHEKLLLRAQRVVGHGVGGVLEIIDKLPLHVVLQLLHLFKRQPAALGGQDVDLLVVEGDAQALGQPLPDLVAAGAELPPDGDEHLGLALGVRLIALHSRFQRAVDLVFPLHKAQQVGLEELLELAHDKAHQQGADDRPLPDADEPVEINQRGRRGDHDQGAVEQRLAAPHHPAGLFRDGKAHALPRRRQDVGREIEHDARRHQRHAAQQIEQRHRVAPRRGQERHHGRRQVHQLAKEQRGHQLQQHGGLEVAPQYQQLGQNVEAVDRRGAVAEVHPGRRAAVQADLVQDVGQRTHRTDAQVRSRGEHHANSHEVKARQVDQQALGPEEEKGSVEFFHAITLNHHTYSLALSVLWTTGSAFVVGVARVVDPRTASLLLALPECRLLRQRPCEGKDFGKGMGNLCAVEVSFKRRKLDGKNKTRPDSSENQNGHKAIAG